MTTNISVLREFGPEPAKPQPGKLGSTAAGRPDRSHAPPRPRFVVRRYPELRQKLRHDLFMARS